MGSLLLSGSGGNQTHLCSFVAKSDIITLSLSKKKLESLSNTNPSYINKIMERAEKAMFINTSGLFSNFPLPFYSFVGSFLTKLELERGTILFLKGVEAKRMFFVVAGEIILTNENKDFVLMEEESKNSGSRRNSKISGKRKDRRANTRTRERRRRINYDVLFYEGKPNSTVIIGRGGVVGEESLTYQEMTDEEDSHKRRRASSMSSSSPMNRGNKHIKQQHSNNNNEIGDLMLEESDAINTYDTSAAVLTHRAIVYVVDCDEGRGIFKPCIEAERDFAMNETINSNQSSSSPQQQSRKERSSTSESKVHSLSDRFISSRRLIANRNPLREFYHGSIVSTHLGNNNLVEGLKGGSLINSIDTNGSEGDDSSSSSLLWSYPRLSTTGIRYMDQLAEKFRSLPPVIVASTFEFRAKKDEKKNIERKFGDNDDHMNKHHQEGGRESDEGGEEDIVDEFSISSSMSRGRKNDEDEEEDGLLDKTSDIFHSKIKPSDLLLRMLQARNITYENVSLVVGCHSQRVEIPHMTLPLTGSSSPPHRRKKKKKSPTTKSTTLLQSSRTGKTSSLSACSISFSTPSLKQTTEIDHYHYGRMESPSSNSTIHSSMIGEGDGDSQQFENNNIDQPGIQQHPKKKQQEEVSRYMRQKLGEGDSQNPVNLMLKLQSQMGDTFMETLKEDMNQVGLNEKEMFSGVKSHERTMSASNLREEFNEMLSHLLLISEEEGREDYRQKNEEEGVYPYDDDDDDEISFIKEMALDLACHINNGFQNEKDEKEKRKLEEKKFKKLQETLKLRLEGNKTRAREFRRWVMTRDKKKLELITLNKTQSVEKMRLDASQMFTNKSSSRSNSNIPSRVGTPSSLLNNNSNHHSRLLKQQRMTIAGSSSDQDSLVCLC